MSRSLTAWPTISHGIADRRRPAQQLALPFAASFLAQTRHCSFIAMTSASKLRSANATLTMVLDGRFCSIPPTMAQSSLILRSTNRRHCLRRLPRLVRSSPDLAWRKAASESIATFGGQQDKRNS